VDVIVLLLIIGISMHKAIKIILIISLTVLFSLLISCQKENKIGSINNLSDVRIIENKINRLKPLLVPDTTQNNTIDHSVSTFCFVPPNFIYYLDRYKKKIYVIVSTNGKEILSFSRPGRGPGEFKNVNLIRYFPDGMISVLDNSLRRITLFDKRGNVKQTIHTPYPLSDIAFMPNGKLLLSSFELIPNYKPLKILSINDEKIFSEFGFIIDPQVKLTERLNFSSFTKINRSLYSSMGMVKILLLPNSKDIIYSQKHPYYLLKYNIETKNFFRFDTKLPYSTDLMDEIIMDEKKESTTFIDHPSARIMAPKCLNNLILIPIFSAGSQNNFLDCYSIDGKFVKRLRIPSLDKGLEAWIVDISPALEIFVLVSAPNHFYWIERFQIDPTVFN